MSRGGVDPDEELLKTIKVTPKLFSNESLKEAAKKLAEYESSLAEETDESKKLTTKYAMMVESLKLDFCE